LTTLKSPDGCLACPFGKAVLLLISFFDSTVQLIFV
jgi:hypothetical protein